MLLNQLVSVPQFFGSQLVVAYKAVAYKKELSVCLFILTKFPTSMLIWSSTFIRNLKVHAMSVYKKRCEFPTSTVSYFSPHFDQSSFLSFRILHSQRFLNFEQFFSENHCFSCLFKTIMDSRQWVARLSKYQNFVQFYNYGLFH